MILRTKYEDEAKFIHWFVENFGEEDASVFVRWLWEREKDGERFVRVLIHIAGLIHSGQRTFESFLLVARMPRDQDEALTEIVAYMMPLVEAAKTKALGHRNRPAVLDEIFADLAAQMREKIRSMFPRRHRATIDGSISVAFKRDNAGHTLIDFPALARSLFEVDPLEATAAASHV